MVVLEKDKMLTLADNTVSLALQKGASEVEVYLYEGHAKNVGIERGQITKSNKILDRGLGIRVVARKAIGFAYTNAIESDDSIHDVIMSALNAARASKPDNNWNGFPEKKPYFQIENTYDRKIVQLSSEDLVTIAYEMLDSAIAAEKNVLPIEGGVSAAFFSSAIANSNGVRGFDKGTYVECSLAAVMKKRNTITPVCFEYDAERNYNINPKWVGKEAARLSSSALNTRKIETKTTNLILTQFAIQSLFSNTLINAIRADNVQRNQSKFKGKLGEKISSDILTIQDDGLLAGGLGSTPFDGEGVPQQKTNIVKKGILKNFLYDNYTAKKEGKKSTGNASRAGYLSTPSIGATNFRILPGNKTSKQLTEEVDEGLLIYYLQGAHSSNPVTGDFSVVATPAWKIKNGEISHSTRGVMLAGNIFEVLKNVKMIANNERKLGSIIAPWILVNNVRIIGK
ncbi:MAG: TldD/PmbA family protein [Candidatus Bathyarchaeota archaeon]|nr:TldD/PmbA family protein [Candidatus Bathyarchaeota archaeon]